MVERQCASVNPTRIIAVTDGDTFTVSLPDWPAYLGQTIGIRVTGIDTPEIRSKNPREKALAIEARRFLSSILGHASVITLRRIQRDKYFRLLADVDIDGHDLSVLMIRGGYARRYTGGTRQPW